MLMVVVVVVVRERSLNRGINEQCCCLSSVFLCLLCQIPQCHFCCCSEAYSDASFQPSPLVSSTFHSGAAERKAEDRHLSSDHGNTALEIASLTEAVYHHITTVAQLQLACFSE